MWSAASSRRFLRSRLIAATRVNDFCRRQVADYKNKALTSQRTPHLCLGFADGGNRIVIAGSKQTERPHVPMTNNSIRVDHENRSRDLSGNQRLRAIEIRHFSIDVRQQTQW